MSGVALHFVTRAARRLVDKMVYSRLIDSGSMVLIRNGIA